MKPNAMVTLCSISLAASQSLLDATSVYPQLSSFRKLLQTYPGLTPPASNQLTVLVPSNQAFNDYLQSTGNSVESLPLDTLSNLLQYQTLSNVLSSAEFTRNIQLLANSQLTNDTFNHRGGTDGQVVLISATPKNTKCANTKTIRQSTPCAVDTVLSGGGATVNMSAIDGPWSGGLFQIIDGFLTLPEECIDTMNSSSHNLTTLVSALERTNLTDTLYNFSNVTCLAPTNVAFVSAGSPDTSLSVPALAQSLKYHTVAGAQYSVGLQDGNILTSLGGPEIKVRVDGQGKIWFNDAMVVQPNVITNNGVIHVLDRVMSMPNSTTLSSTSSQLIIATSSPTNSATASAKPTSSAMSGSTTLHVCTAHIAAASCAAVILGILFITF